MNFFRKILLILLLVSAFVFFWVNSSNIFAYTNVKSYAPKYGITTERVNFRQGPSTGFKLVKTLGKGTTLKMVADSGDFYIVQLASNEVGAVSKKYVKTSSTSPKGASVYYSTGSKMATTKSSTNLRGGPGTNFRLILTLPKNSEIKVVGYIDNFYLVITKSNYVGMIRKDLLQLVTSQPPATITPPTNTVRGDTLEELVLSYINQERAKVKVPALKMDAPLLKIARLKATDMTTNKYFAHESPTYGSPFKMMQDNGIDYKVAGENIAGNPDLKAAVVAWMGSPAHKENIISNAYNYAGIGVSKSDTYGYVIVAMFLGR